MDLEAVVHVVLLCGRLAWKNRKDGQQESCLPLGCGQY